jgi:hypothetical protein
MARSHWILPRADSTCGKVFHPDRRTAEGHRIALKFWNQATGRNREGYQLVVYRCKRCCGFHLSNKKIEPKPDPIVSFTLPCEPEQNWQEPSPAVEESADPPGNHLGRWDDADRLNHSQEDWNHRITWE